MFLLVEVTALLAFRHDLYFFPSSCHCQYLHCCVFGRCQLSCSWQVRLNNIRDKMIGDTVAATPVELLEIRILASPRLFTASGPGKAVPSHRLWFPRISGDSAQPLFQVLKVQSTHGNEECRITLRPRMMARSRPRLIQSRIHYADRKKSKIFSRCYR